MVSVMTWLCTSKSSCPVPAPGQAVPSTLESRQGDLHSVRHPDSPSQVAEPQDGMVTLMSLFVGYMYEQRTQASPQDLISRVGPPSLPAHQLGLEPIISVLGSIKSTLLTLQGHEARPRWALHCQPGMPLGGQFCTWPI